jgi:hypothetical protein
MTTQELKDKARQQLAALPTCECRSCRPERQRIGVFFIVACSNCGGRAREHTSRPGFLTHDEMKVKVS